MFLSKKYESWLEIRGYSRRTMSSYIYHVERFLKKHPDPSRVINEDIENYFSELRQSISDRTVEIAFYALQNFFRYIKFHERSEVSIDGDFLKSIKPLHRKPKMPRIIPNDDLSAILRAPDLKTLRGCRDYTIMLFLLHGLRASEICAINIDQVYSNGWGPDRHIFINIKGKGRKERRIIMEESGDTEWAWNRYLKMRGDDGCKIAFPAMLGRGRLVRFKRGGLHKMLKRYCTKLGIPNANPHIWRHTTAIQLLEADIPLQDIQVFLGHSSLLTTEKYLLASGRGQKKAAYAGFINKIKKADARFRRWRPKK
ncbi:MAG: tyrosine-type recombinase/integrase [Deltaproteobacteria bacterium]|nr:tyrosine-type recombinase/integrase [Deltaproteobacteria bacterium]